MTPLASGSRLGPYEITAKLGAGGMGEVWRARDTRLDREVALKVLPAGFADDPDRHARFEREAKVLASLNHPNIAHLYGLEHLEPKVDSRQSTVDSSPTPPDPAAGKSSPEPRAPNPDVERASSALHVLIMELVEGEDLAHRLSRGAIPIDEAMPIARQIAEALEAAHGQGIVHRDLKPANVKLRPDGAVKVLDFGLAKALDPAASGSAADLAHSPTITHAATQVGLVLGTAAYMAPEQARGKSVDTRADIWAFGVVLYEMLAGQQLFRGETVTDVLAAVVKTDPDWRALPADTPAGVRRLLRRCLEKDPARRLRDIGDARLEITDPDASGAPGGLALAQRPFSRRWLVATALAALVAGAAGGVWWRASRDTEPTAWTATRLGGPAVADLPRLAPDGQLLAFLAMVDRLTQVAVMKPGTSSWTVLTHDRAHGLVDSINWSPDGSRIYYDRWTDTPSGIYSVPALGGDERLVIENATLPQPLPDGSLLFFRINAARQQQLHRFSPGSGRIDALPVVVPFATLHRRLIRLLHDGRIVVFGQPMSEGARGNALYSMAPDSGELRQIGPNVSEVDILSLAVRPDDGAVLVALREASTYRVLELTPGRASEPRPLMTLLSQPALDAGPDRALYVSLRDRPVEILRFPESGRGVELMAGGPGLVGSGSLNLYGTVPLPDGRVLVTAHLSGGWRVLVAASGKEPGELVETDEETRGPMTLIGQDRAALMIGPDAAPEIAVVAVSTGRVLRRLEAPGNVVGMAASPDGRTLYVAADHSISGVPVDGGVARSICPGDSLAVDPDTGDLIVKLDELDRFRLVRVSPQGGPPRPIVIQGDLRLVTEPLTPGAVRSGRLLLPVATVDSWYWYAGVLDLSNGRLEKIPLDYFTDFHSVTWAADGSVVGAGVGLQSALWRFTPVRR